MVDLARLVELDTTDPGSRMDAISSGNAELVNTSGRVLLCLVQLEELLEDVLGIPSLYLLEDSYVRSLLGDAARVDPEGVRPNLVLLNSVDLIFRFTCARKFRVGNVALKQTRASAWGRWYCEEHGVARCHPAVADLVRDRVRPVLQEYRAIYAILASKLAARITPEVAETVKKLNGQVPLKLLS